jgi:hypothetical protein
MPSWIMLKDFGRHGNRCCPSSAKDAPFLTRVGSEAQWRNVEHLVEYESWNRDPWAEARAHTVEHEVVAAGVKNARVCDAMRTVPRHESVPVSMRRQAPPKPARHLSPRRLFSGAALATAKASIGKILVPAFASIPR